MHQSKPAQTTYMFVGNVQAYNSFLAWLKTPCTSSRFSKECICIVGGGAGTGKTHGIHAAIQACGLELHLLNSDECTNSRDFKDYFTKLTCANIVAQFAGMSLSGRVLFIDDIENMASIDRTFLNNLNSIIASGTLPAIRIIIACNISEMKSVAKSVSVGASFTLHRPPDASVFVFLRATFPTLSAEVVMQLAEGCSGNISNALNMAQMELVDLQDDTETEDESDIITSRRRVESQADVFASIAQLYEASTRDQVRMIVDLDPWLHPLRFHENIIHEWKQRKGLQSQKENAYIQILWGLCQWDQLMVASKRLGYEAFQAIEHVTGVILSMQNLPRKKTGLASTDDFTLMFNYLSLKKKNALSRHEGTFPWQHIGGFHKQPYDANMKCKRAPSKKSF